MHHRQFRFLLVVSCTAFAALVAVFWLPRGEVPPEEVVQFRAPVIAIASSAKGLTSPAGKVVGLGRLEPTEGIISISGLPGDRLARLLVREGETVAPGAELAELASRRLRELELEALQSQMSEAQSRHTTQEASQRAQQKVAEFDLERAQSALKNLNSQNDRVELLNAARDLAQEEHQRLADVRLTSPDLVSAYDVRRQELAAKKAVAEARMASTESQVRQSEAELSIRAAQAQLEAVQASTAALQAAIPQRTLEKQQQLAEENLRQTTIRAPQAAEEGGQFSILQVMMRQGEVLGHTPILRLADVRHMVCMAEIYEADVKRVRVGQQAVICSPAFHAPFDQGGLRGKVIHVGQSIKSPRLQSIDPYAQADRHVVEVRIELDGPSTVEAAKLVDLQVDVTILADSSIDPDSCACSEASPNRSAP